MRISDWSSDVCSSDLAPELLHRHRRPVDRGQLMVIDGAALAALRCGCDRPKPRADQTRRRQHRRQFPLHASSPQSGRVTCSSHRSEEHTSELQSLMRTSYAVFCLNKKITTTNRLKQKPN